MHSVIHGSPRDAFPTGRATVIIDEASMADILTVHRFLHALQHAGVEIFRIVLVGDTHQLPPIRHASVQRALLDAECIPKMTMTASQFDSPQPEAVKEFLGPRPKSLDGKACSKPSSPRSL